MTEAEYLGAIAQEIFKSEDPRVKAVLAWTTNIEATLKSCGGDEKLQKDQAASATSEIVLELNRIEEMRENTFPHYHPTVLNKDDKYLPQFFYRPDFKERTITVDVAVVEMALAKKIAEPKFEPIVVKMREEIR